MANLDERICIIGAGLAGLSSAMYLSEKGYHNFTIYEKHRRIGGKYYSPKILINDQERSFELNPIMFTKSSKVLKELEDYIGIKEEDKIKLSWVYKDENGNDINPFEVKDKLNIKELMGISKYEYHIGRMMDVINERYQGYQCYGHRKISKGRYEGLDKSVQYIEGENEKLKDLGMPFNTFLNKKKLEDVNKLLPIIYGPLGYGDFDKIPAAYMFKYIDEDVIEDFTNRDLWTYRDGVQKILEDLDLKLGNKTKLKHEVKKINYLSDGKIEVTFKHFDDEVVEVFDKVIVSTALDDFNDYSDISDDVKALFEKIKYEEIVSFIGTFDKNMGPNTSGYIYDNLVNNKVGHLFGYYHRYKDLGANCPLLMYAIKDKDVSYEDTIEVMKKDMEKLGYLIKDTLYTQKHYIGPYVSSEDYLDGFYDELDHYQGYMNTYYVGEIISFGSMEHTLISSKDIIERFF